MKKIITILFALVGFFAATSYAQQGTLCNPDFNFTVNQSTNAVQFVSLNANTTSYVEHQWWFGDGAPTSNLANPEHVYAPGTYNVVHVVSYRSPNDSNVVFCMDSLNRFITIAGVQPCNIHASFRFERDSVETNKVYFTNLSASLTANTFVRWTFGDGTISNELNPTHIYQTSGAYTVCLLVRRDSLCADDTCAVVQVQVPANTCNLQPYYNTRFDSSNQLLVHFFNQTVNFAATDSVRWTFGDGTSSFDLNPNHTFAQFGTYNVCLLVKRTVPGTVPCIREFCQLITVLAPPPPCNLHAAFSFVRDSVQTNKVYFTNLSPGLTPNTIVHWNFGDGTGSAEPNPVHIYQSSGAYTVCLLVRRDSLCAADTCQLVQVQVPSSCNLVVDFSSMMDSLHNNVIHFTNLSSPLAATDSVTWTFGDGTASHDVNATHTYAQGGVFSVCLLVKKSGTNTTVPCVRELCRSIIVDTPQVQCNLQANFSIALDSIHPNTVYFNNQSAPVAATDSIRWTFGDGSSSADMNPVHTYNQPGTYSVCLRVKKVQVPGAAPCVSEYCRMVTIPPADCNLVVHFDYASDSINGGAPNVYHFVNTSIPATGTDSTFWNFGDGSPLAINPNAPVTHTYAQPGIYVVCLLVKRLVPGTINILCERQLCQTIIVQMPPSPCDQLQVNFQWNADSANNRKIYFHNLSSPVTANTSASWTFGDGSAGSQGFNADHIYAQPGTYNVCLRMYLGNTCVKDTCHTVIIPPSTIDSCNIHPSFTAHVDSFNHRKVYFSNTTVSSAAANFAVWSFGDGTSGTGWNADHIYTMPGWYAVCLSVTNGNICTRTWCDSIFVPGNVIPPVNCDTFHLGYVYRVDDYMPNKLFFFATANAPVYDQQWSFTRFSNNSIVTINHNNPMFIFPDTGAYLVCVRGSFAVGCIKEYCEVVHINSTAVPAQCVVNAYPNPAHDQVSYNVQLDAPILITSTVVNLQGLVVAQYAQPGLAGNNLVTLNIQNLPPGFYNVRIMYGGRICHTRFQKF